MTMNTNYGCGKTRQEVVAERGPTVQSAPQGEYQIFIESLRKGVYAGIAGEINKVAREAAGKLEHSIKMIASQVALQISSEVSISSYGRDRVTIVIELPDGLIDSIVRDTKLK